MFWQKRSPETARLADGLRIYAIGDIHGRFDLFKALLDIIGEDTIGRGAVRCRLIILGDFIDRGPASRQVVETLFQHRNSPNFICLKGNHENAMVESYRGSYEALRYWLEYGGKQTLVSWGIPAEMVEITNLSAVMDAMIEQIPVKFVDWMEGLPLRHSAGDYLFVHAGVNPRKSLRNQIASDLLNIRGPFLENEKWLGAVIVHGHSESSEPIELYGNRIGIDTGAYRTGVLSALALEQDRRWILQTSPDA